MKNQMTQVGLVGGGSPRDEEKEREKDKVAGTKSSAVSGSLTSFLAAMKNMSNTTAQQVNLGADVAARDAKTNAYIDAIQNMTGPTEERTAIPAGGGVDSNAQPTVDKTTAPSTTTNVAAGKLPGTVPLPEIVSKASDPAGNGGDTPVADKEPTDEGASTEDAGSDKKEPTDEGTSTEDAGSDKQEPTDEGASTEDTGSDKQEPTNSSLTVPKVQAGMDGASGYGEFLKNFGSDTDKNYAESVRAANDDYYRALMTYGKKAEALAGNGLTGAGVSDYGSAAAYAARQGAVAVAGAAKQQADAENARSYAEYLQNFRAQQEAAAKEKNAGRTNTFNAILAQGITDPEVAKTLLRQSGYFTEAEVESLGGQAAAYAATQVQNAKDEAAAVQNASDNAAKTNIYNSLLQQGLTDVNVIASQLRMSGLFTEEEIAQYSGEIAGAAKVQQDAADSANVQTAQDAYNSALANGASPSEAKTYIESQFGRDVAEQVAENAGAMVAASFEDSLKVAESSSTYTPFAEDNVLNKAVLDQQLATGMISKEQYDGYLARVQDLNEKWIMDVQALARNEYRADDAAAMLGIELGEDADEIAYMDASIRAARDAVVKLYESGAISSEIANRYFVKDFDAEKEAIAENKNKNGIRDVCDTILSYKSLGEQVESDVYTELLKNFLKEVDIEQDSFMGQDGYKVKWNGKKLIVYEDKLSWVKEALKKGSVSGDETVRITNNMVNVGNIGDVIFTYNQLDVLVDMIDAWKNSKAGKE